MPTRNGNKASSSLDPEHISALLENGERERASELLEAALERTPRSTRLKLVNARLDLRNEQRAAEYGLLLLRCRRSRANDPLYQALHHAAQETVRSLLQDAGDFVRRGQLRALEDRLAHAAHLCQHDPLLTLSLADRLLLSSRPARDDMPSFLQTILNAENRNRTSPGHGAVARADDPEYALKLTIAPPVVALAVKYAQLALERAAGDPDAHAPIALFLFQLLIISGNSGEAVALLEANPGLRESAPNSIVRLCKLLLDGHMRRLTRMLRLGQWEPARTLVETVGRDVLPPWFRGLMLAEIALHDGQMPEALRALEEAVSAPEQTETTPLQLDSYLALRAALEAQGAFERCAACGSALPAGADECASCETAVDSVVLRMDMEGGQSWQSARARWLLAGLAAETGDYERARAELAEIAPLIEEPDHPAYAPYNALRARVDAQLAEQQALRQLNTLIAASTLTGAQMEAVRRKLDNPGTPWAQTPLRARRRFVQRLLEAGCISEAQAMLEKAFAGVRQRRALNALREAVQAAAADAVQHQIQRSVSALQQGNVEAAVAAARQACQISPDNLLALHTRARALQAVGDDMRALNDFRQVAEWAGSPDLRAAVQLEIARLLAANRLTVEAAEALDGLTQPEALALRERLDRARRGRPVLALERRTDSVMYDTLAREANMPLVHVTFAIVLRATSRPWGVGEAEWLDSVLGSQFRFVQMLGGLIAHEGDPVFGLRVICEPQPETPERGRLTFALLARVAASGEARALALADQLFNDLQTALPAQNSHVYWFEPVSDEDELASLLQPFEAATYSEILRREQGSPEDDTYTIYPYLPASPDLHALCWVLLRQPAPTMISLHLQPAVLYAWEVEHLGHGLALDAPVAGPLMQAPGMASSAWQALQRAARTQVNLTHLNRLNARAFLLQVNAVGAWPVSSLFAQSAAAALFGALQQVGGALYGGWDVQTAATDAEIVAAQRNCSELELERWVTDGANERPARLRYLVSEAEAAYTFRLPVPLSNGLPGVKQLGVKPVLPPAGMPVYGTIYGESVAQVDGRTARIRHSDDDRRRHVFVLGRTGTGKSTLLSQLALQDIAHGKGVCVVDPHGELIEEILERIPASRADDVIIFDAADEAHPIGMNLLEHSSESEKQRIVTEFIAMLMRMYDPGQIGIVGPRFEHNVRMIMLTAMVVPGNTLIEVVRVLTNPDYAKSLAALVTDPVVRMYWDQIARTNDFHKSEILDYLVSKFNRFVGDERVRHIIGQRQTTLNFREIMDRRKVLLVNLSKGLVGSESAQFLGLLLVQRLLITALERADVSADQRPDFVLYVDEFQNFATPLFSTILSEGRKYGLMTVLANQYLTQLDAKVRSALFGNVGTLVSFRLGLEDAHILAPEMYPTLNADDLINLSRYTAAAKLLVNGATDNPFTMRTLPLLQSTTPALARQIRQMSRERYGRDVNTVSAEIRERFKNLMK